MFWDTAPKTFRKSSFMMLVVTRIFVRWPLVVGLGVVPPRDGRNNIVRPGYRIRPEPKSWRLAMDLGVNDSRSPLGSSTKTSVVTVLALNHSSSLLKAWLALFRNCGEVWWGCLQGCSLPVAWVSAQTFGKMAATTIKGGFLLQQHRTNIPFTLCTAQKL